MIICFICSGIAEIDEMVAVEDFIDVGNILAKIDVALRHQTTHFYVFSTLRKKGPHALHG